jgi:hypothetical protein
MRLFINRTHKFRQFAVWFVDSKWMRPKWMISPTRGRAQLGAVRITLHVTWLLFLIYGVLLTVTSAMYVGGVAYEPSWGGMWGIGLRALVLYTVYAFMVDFRRAAAACVIIEDSIDDINRERADRKG